MFKEIITIDSDPELITDKSEMDIYSIENVIQESLEGIKGRSRPSQRPLDTEETEYPEETDNPEETGETEFPEASEVIADKEILEVNELTIDEKGKVLKETESREVVTESPKKDTESPEEDTESPNDSNPSIVQRMDVLENQVQILKEIIVKYVLVDKTSVDKNGKWIDG